MSAERASPGDSFHLLMFALVNAPAGFSVHCQHGSLTSVLQVSELTGAIQLALHYIVTSEGAGEDVVLPCMMMPLAAGET